MIAQDFYLPRYGWHVRVYYAVTTYRAKEIVTGLRMLGCSGERLKRAKRNLEESRLDTGLTFSNLKMKETLMVISMTSTPGQFLNSWTHEMFHLCRHVARCFYVDPYGEEAAYLAGTVGQKMFPVAKKFLCEHCKDELCGKR